MTERADFAAGCFWGIEEGFRKQKGVLKTEVGYEGGSSESPSYEDVCSGGTGHAETVHLEYDPAQISYAELLKLFWKMHDPTTRDRQGPDVGSQYRSVIFCHTPQQKELAESSKTEASKNFKNPIVTQIVPAQKFWRAEEYHQQYIAKGGPATCPI